MLINRDGYGPDCRRRYFFDLGNDEPAPDYRPVANASTESARIAAELGRGQLDESRRQYDANTEIARPVIDAQLGIMKQTADQGQDYYDYMVQQQRPIEAALNARALTYNGATDAAARNAVTSAQRTAANQLLTGANTIRDTSTANADSLRGTSSSLAGELASGARGISGGLNEGASRIAGDLTAGSNAVADELSGKGSDIAAGIRRQSSGYEGDIGGDIDTFTGGNQAIYDKYGADIEGDVGRAVADTRAGQTQAANLAIRQALRYGGSAPAATTAVQIANAERLAAAANNARTAGIDKARANLGAGVGMEQNLFQTAGGLNVQAGGLESDTAKSAAGTKATALTNAAATKAGMLSQGANIEAGALQSGVALRDAGTRSAIDLSQSGTKDALALEQAGLQGKTASAATARDLAISDTARDIGTKMDVAGLYRGLPGASAGAYSVANTSGNNAVSNQVAPGTSYMTGLNQGANTTLAGQQLQLGGLTSVLNNQANVYNNGGSDLSGIGSLIGGAAKAYGAYAGAAALAGSSKEIKTDKEPVSEGAAMAGLQRIPVEKWRYKDGVADGGEHVGPYAEDVQRQFGDQAAPGGKEIDLVTMNGITIAALKGLQKKVAGLERIVKRRGGNVIEGEFSTVDDQGRNGGGNPVLPHVGLVRMGA